MSKPKNPMHKHERCPDCNAQMGSAFVRVSDGKRRRWNNKDIKVCTNPQCSTILTHIKRNIYVKQTRINIAKKLGLTSERGAY
ncbi:MAG TPA: hypothetical protein VNK25_01550 [Candidatus Nitrosotenuis sp.]|nr:hypothetical protein [Candidatus Nitrosotenuis sp.]